MHKGNAEAFLIHLGLRFGLELKPSCASMVHALLRELGEQVLPAKQGKQPPDPNGSAAGKFQQPSPDKWRAK